MRKVIYVVMDYYRYRFLKTLLDGGITLDVFGDFWQDSILGHHPNLVCHPGVSAEESLVVYARSRMSLNVMSWHKDGYTERVANIMLARTVLVTDQTTSLAEEYCDGEDLLFFDIAHPERLLEKVKALRKDPARMEQIAAAGYEKTRRSHTWEIAVRKLTKVL
jgi:spore maturation protein CgeB